jgi:hypothetical protein
LAWPSAAAAQYWSDYSEGHVIPRLPVNDRQSHVLKKARNMPGFFQPPEAIDLLPIDKTAVHTK